MLLNNSLPLIHTGLQPGVSARETHETVFNGFHDR
jgi:hypothetical protein